MIWLYRLLFLPILVVVLPYYLLRMIHRGGYLKDFRHRFGRIGPLEPTPDGKVRVWIQAVSVGELLAIEPLMESFSNDEKVEIVLTTTTSTGYRLALEKYHGKAYSVGLFPLDFWPFSAAAWKRIAPDAIILTESELWPEHLHQSRRRRVPAILINARISDRSFARMKRSGRLSGPLLDCLTTILCSSRQTERRFRALGVGGEKLILTGNIKFDVSVGPRLSAGDITAMKEAFGLTVGPPGTATDPLIIVGSSTWPGEERALVAAYKEGMARGIACRLLLVPRHAERRVEIESMLRAEDIPFHFRSASPEADGEVAVYVGDTTGELKVLTQVGDIVFAGKSLPPHNEGQTPIEAAALGKPLLFGRGMSNFREISESLVSVGAAIQVSGPEELKREALSLLVDDTKRESMALSARQWHAANRGATEATLRVLWRVLNRHRSPVSSERT